MFFYQSIDNGVNGKLVAARMHAEFKGICQPKFANGKGDDAEILVDLLLELPQVADVIAPFVKPPGEFWGDGLDRNTFPGDHRQNEKQFHWVLRRVGLVD